jgi:membrane protein DedA with SNARE-associated domain
VLHWIAHLVGSLGYSGVALLMAIENVVLPLPSELIMSLAGFEAASGRISLPGVIIAGTIGGVVGAFPLYFLARALGEERLGRWVERHGKWILLRKAHVNRASDRFERNGAWAVFLSQLLPGIRGLISIPAGFASMNFVLFTATNFAGTVIWCVVLAYLGYLLGAHYERVHAVLGPIGWVLIVGLVLWATVWLVQRRRRSVAR